VITFLLLLLVVLLGAGTTWGLRGVSAGALSLRRRLLTIYGALGSLFSLSLPWLSFSLLGDLRILPLIVLQNLSGALHALSDLLKLTPLGIVAWVLDQMMWMPGYQLIVIMPPFHPFARLAVAAPAGVGLFSLLTALIAFLARGRGAGKVAGALQLFFAVAGFLLLLSQLPILDQWGTTGDFKTGLLAVSVGVALEIGPWIALTALLLMAIGALRTLAESPYEVPEYVFQTGQSASWR
jgi:hypothetical protein